MIDKYLVLFRSPEEGFKFRDLMEDGYEWRVVKCSPYVSDK